MNVFAPALIYSALRRAILRRAILRCAMAALAMPLAIAALAAPARATTIERVVSSGGIEAWLVREPAVPLIAVDFAFVGGAVQDPLGKAGTANLATSLLDEGAGDLDSKAFQDRLERSAQLDPPLP